MKVPYCFSHTKAFIKCVQYIAIAFYLTQSQFVNADGWDAEVTVKRLTGVGREYTMRLTFWDFSSTVPNPLYGCDVESSANGCSVALSTGIGAAEYFGTRVDRGRDIVAAKTMGELGLVMQKRGIWFGKTHIGRISNSLPACSFPGYMISGGVWSKFPGGPCIYPELAPTTCSLDVPSIEIRHTEYDRNVNGSRASANINVTCTEPTAIVVKGMYGNVNSIVLDSKINLESVITLNGEPLSTGISISATQVPTQVTVTSTLKSQGEPPPGEYQGSTVLIVSLQ